jgi:hypothetical protein
LALARVLVCAPALATASLRSARIPGLI